MSVRCRDYLQSTSKSTSRVPPEYFQDLIAQSALSAPPRKFCVRTHYRPTNLHVSAQLLGSNSEGERTTTRAAMPPTTVVTCSWDLAAREIVATDEDGTQRYRGPTMAAKDLAARLKLRGMKLQLATQSGKRLPLGKKVCCGADRRQAVQGDARWSATR